MEETITRFTIGDPRAPQGLLEGRELPLSTPTPRVRNMCRNHLASLARLNRHRTVHARVHEKPQYLSSCTAPKQNYRAAVLYKVRAVSAI